MIKKSGIRNILVKISPIREILLTICYLGIVYIAKNSFDLGFELARIQNVEIPFPMEFVNLIIVTAVFYSFYFLVISVKIFSKKEEL